MADHLSLPVVDQSLKEAFSPRLVFNNISNDLVNAKTLSTDELDNKGYVENELKKESLKKSEISASSSSIDFVGNLTHVM